MAVDSVELGGACVLDHGRVAPEPCRVERYTEVVVVLDSALVCKNTGARGSGFFSKLYRHVFVGVVHDRFATVAGCHHRQ